MVVRTQKTFIYNTQDNPPMKKILALICIFIVTITLLSACGGNFGYTTIRGDGFNRPTASPYKSETLPNKDDVYFKVYVCGAVEREGYYIVPEGKTVADVVAMAGLLPETIMPKNATTYIKTNCQIAVGYYQNGETFHCLNVNGATVLYNLTAQNIPAEIVEKLHTYLKNHGKITNKQMLKSILTAEEYQQSHYKLFVSEADYESAS